MVTKGSMELIAVTVLPWEDSCSFLIRYHPADDAGDLDSRGMVVGLVNSSMGDMCMTKRLRLRWNQKHACLLAMLSELENQVY
jgi:hypothetical protein